MREHEIVRAGVGRKFQTPSVYESLTVFENLEMSYPKGRTAFGAWAFKRTAAVIAEGGARSPSWSTCRTA